MKYDTIGFIGFIQILDAQMPMNMNELTAHLVPFSDDSISKAGSSAHTGERRADVSVESCFLRTHEMLNAWRVICRNTLWPADEQNHNRVKRSQISMFFQTTWRQKPVVLLYFREQRPPCFWSEAQRLSNTKMSAVNNNEPTILKSKLVQVNINIDININKFK